MSNTKSVIHLRVYYSNSKDAELIYNANGDVRNENVLVKLMHNTLEWANYLKNIRGQGFIKAVVEKVIGDDSKESIQKEVDEAMNPTVVKELTQEQKEIAELKAIVKGMQGNSKPRVETPVNDELADARADYHAKFGKKGHHTWSVEKIREKINNA